MRRVPHYVPDDQLKKELRVTFDHVKEWLQMCQNRRVSCHFFWRTTVPGHANCSSFSEPVNNLTFMEEWVASHPTGKQTIKGPIDFHWQDYQHQNELVLDLLDSIFRESQDADQGNQTRSLYRILDAYHLNLLRPDQHGHEGDCLHNCAPGKVSVYNRLLLHWLRMDRNPYYY